MRKELVLFVFCVCTSALPKDNVLTPFLQTQKGINPVIDQIMPFLETLNEASTLDMMDNATYVAYRRSQAKSIHLVLDTIVRSVENNLAEVDAYFTALKNNFRRQRTEEFAKLDAATKRGIAKDKEIDDLVETKEAQKIKLDKAYGAAQGELKAQKLVVQQTKQEEITAKLAADERFKRDIFPINQAHNESREMFIDELMFIAKIRQMVNKLNADYIHDKVGTAHPTPSTRLGTHAPTAPPSPAPTFADLYGHRFETPNPTQSPTPAPTTYLSSCAAIKTANGAVPPSGDNMIQTPTGAFVNAYCDFTGDNAYTIVKCDSFGGACIPSTGNDGGDTCTKNGLQLLVPRNKEHWQSLMRNANGMKYLSKIPGVYKSNSGMNEAQNCIMRSRGQHANTKGFKGAHSCSGFRAVDGGSWWLRDEYYIEPDSDYIANQWICLDPITDVNYMTFSDGTCGPKSNDALYLCSTNDYDPNA